MNIGQLDGQPLALQIFNGMTVESICVNERWAKDQLFRCVCFAGGRHQTILDETVGPIFQSTSSVWRTTAEFFAGLGTAAYFNPPPPCGGRPAPPGLPPAVPHFNPRPPCGGRPIIYLKMQLLAIFQSTSSVWRTTSCPDVCLRRCLISIHVLRVEDDEAAAPVNAVSLYFNPRPPCGGRQRPPRLQPGTTYFNPRPPCGGRPPDLRRRERARPDFNPRPPCGGRRHASATARFR